MHPMLNSPGPSDHQFAGKGYHITEALQSLTLTLETLSIVRGFRILGKCFGYNL